MAISMNLLAVFARTRAFACLLCALVCAAAESAAPDLAANWQIQSLGPVQFVEWDPAVRGGPDRQLLLFVHGTPGSLTGFFSYLNDPLLRERFHMIAVTRPGWLRRDDPKIPDLGQQAAALAPLLRRNRSTEAAILLGHSYGGPVIARTAMDYPDLVAGLVFVASTGDPALSGPRWYNRVATVLPELLLGADLKGANAEILPLRPQLEAMLPRWQTLTMPTLIVQGDRDRLVNPDNARFLQGRLVQADVTLLWRPGQGHFVLWEEEPLIRDSLLARFPGDSGVER
jgi:pimeloyl-ACP methyl ester carboxylesterase